MSHIRFHQRSLTRNHSSKACLCRCDTDALAARSHFPVSVCVHSTHCLKSARNVHCNKPCDDATVATRLSIRGARTDAAIIVLRCHACFSDPAYIPSVTYVPPFPEPPATCQSSNPPDGRSLRLLRSRARTVGHNPFISLTYQPRYYSARAVHSSKARADEPITYASRIHV